MKASCMSLEFVFDKAIGERGADRRQIRIALSILRILHSIALMSILRDITATGNAFTLDYAVVLFIIYREWSQMGSNAGPGYS